MSKGRSTTKVTVKNQECDECDVNVTFDWWYDPGVRYYPDGSGCPPDSGAEVVDYDAADGDLPDWVTDELVCDAFDAAYDSGNIQIDAY